MEIKDELLEGHIKRVVKESLQDVIFDSSCVVDTLAVKILSKIRDILADDDLSDFDAIEKIVCVLEDYNISGGGRHDF